MVNIFSELPNAMAKTEVPKQASDALARLGPFAIFSKTTACRLIRDWLKCDQLEAENRFDILVKNGKVVESGAIGLLKNTTVYTLNIKQ